MWDTGNISARLLFITCSEAIITHDLRNALDRRYWVRIHFLLAFNDSLTQETSSLMRASRNIFWHSAVYVYYSYIVVLVGIV